MERPLIVGQLEFKIESFGRKKLSSPRSLLFEFMRLEEFNIKHIEKKLQIIRHNMYEKGQKTNEPCFYADQVIPKTLFTVTRFPSSKIVICITLTNDAL